MEYALFAVGAVIVALLAVTVLRGAPFVPTHKKVLSRAFNELFPLTQSDMVVDLGAGSGTVLQHVAKRGAAAIGYEINPLLVVYMKLRFLHRKNISVELKDYLLLESLPKAVTVVYVFATSRDIKRVHKKMVQWSKDRPLYLVSYGFAVPDKQPEKVGKPFMLYRYE